MKLGPVNAYIIEDGDNGVTLIDTGYEKSAQAIEEGIRSIGREPADVTNILLTHAHPDHLGSAAHLSASGTPVSIHGGDASIPPEGILYQTMSAGPGLINWILFRLLIARDDHIEFPAFEPHHQLADGQVLDVAGGIEVIHTPGHTAGHVCLLWRRDSGVLLAGDVASNLMGLGYMLGYDDLDTAKTSLRKLAEHEFEVAVFGHGRPTLSGASDRFSRKFG